MLSASASAAISAGLCLFALTAQAAPQDRLLGEPYPFELRPKDAIYGHLIEGRFLEPLGIAFDEVAQELLVADSKAGRIGIFDVEGLPLYTFGSRRVLTDPRRVCADPSGRLFVLDAAAQELKSFNYRGEPLEPLRFAGPPEEDRVVGRIGSFERDADGRWYVIDAEEQRVFVYGPDLEFERELAPPKEPFNRLTALAVAADGVVCALDFHDTPVHLFAADGSYLLGFGDRSLGLQGFSAPIAADFDEDGFLFIVDMLRHDVKIFDRTGAFRGRFGGWFGPYTGGRNPGEMLYPVDIAIAPRGMVYVAERYGNRVQLFTRRPRPVEDAPPSGRPIEAAGPPRDETNKPTDERNRVPKNPKGGK